MRLVGMGRDLELTILQDIAIGYMNILNGFSSFVIVMVIIVVIVHHDILG